MRSALGQRLRACKQGVAETVTGEFFERHPDWAARYGERGRQLGIEDACFHVEFLASAIELEAVAAYEDYARWTARTLAARGIEARFVAENIEQVGAAMAERMVGEDRELVERFAEAGRAAALAPPLAAASGPGALAPERNAFLHAALSGQRQGALTIAAKALAETGSITELYLHVFQETMYEVGRLWEANRISVAQEHMATAVTQYVVAQLYPRIPRAERPCGKLLVTGVQGELHQLGAQLVADVAEADGWDVRFLGTNVPLEAIVAAAEEHAADVVGISVTLLSNVSALARLVSALRAKLTARKVSIVVGGSAFRTAPAMARAAGADAFASDLRTARDVLRGLGHGDAQALGG